MIKVKLMTLEKKIMLNTLITYYLSYPQKIYIYIYSSPVYVCFFLYWIKQQNCGISTLIKKNIIKKQYSKHKMQFFKSTI